MQLKTRMVRVLATPKPSEFCCANMSDMWSVFEPGTDPASLWLWKRSEFGGGIGQMVSFCPFCGKRIEVSR